jgi:hypothetical protein
MPKRLLQLPEDAVLMLAALPETGMGFYVIKGRFPQAYVDNVYIVGGDLNLLPLRHAEFFSVADLIDGAALPVTAEAAAGFIVSSSAASRHAASLPSGYKPAQDCVPVFATLSLSEPMVLSRYLGSAIDPRLGECQLSKGTVLTSHLNHSDAHTGFAAVSRFGHPLPSPLCNVFEYELPAGAQFQVSTVLPCFGQVGGGIELRLLADAPVTACGQQRLPAI